MTTDRSQLNIPSVIKSDEVDLLALARTVWHGKFWIGLCAFLAGLAGIYYLLNIAVPMYPARAIVALETQESNVVDFESVLSGGGGGSEEVNTQVEVIKSRNVTTKLVDRLNLIDDPEFNLTLRPINPYDPIRLAKSVLGMQDPPLTDVEIKNQVIDNVISKISVSNIRQSLVFSINTTTQDPLKSAKVANTLADIYIQDALDVKFDATEQASKWLSEKAAELKQELEASELKVKQFSSNTQLVNEESLALLSRQLKDMRQRVTDLRSDREVISARLNALQTVADSPNLDIIAQTADDARLSNLAAAAVSDPTARKDFQTRLDNVLNQLKVEYERADQQLNTMIKSEQGFSLKIDSQSSDLVQLQQLQREAEANGLLYESFLSRLKETTIQQGLQKPDSRLLSEAVPRQRSSPRTGVVLVMATIFGAIVGSGLVLLKEARNNTFRTADDLEDITGMRVLGTIPKATGKARTDVLNYARLKPTSVFAEAIRNLRTSILLSNPDNQPQVIMSTSSVPGEGKTTQSLTLAQNMAGLGKRVLVLEGDIRKRIFAEYFDIRDKAGFIAVMSGQIALKDAIFQHDDMGIDILIGEQSMVNATDIFSSIKFKDFMSDLRTKYDFIVIDTAPVLAVPDARVIGQHADAIIYSVLWDSTTKTQVKQGVSMLTSVGLNITGLVLGQVNAKQMKKYGHAGQYGYDDAGGYYDE